MTEFPVSMIHPDAPEIFSATALFTAPIDLEGAAARVGTLWNESIAFAWERGGSILRFALRDVVVLLSPVSGEALPERGRLPAHGFHVALTCFAPMEDVGGFGAEANGFGREGGDSEGDVGDRSSPRGIGAPMACRQAPGRPGRWFPGIRPERWGTPRNTGRCRWRGRARRCPSTIPTSRRGSSRANPPSERGTGGWRWRRPG